MEFNDFVKQYVRQQSSNYYTKFWANTASANGLTVKYDGKEILVKPESIYVVDLGQLAGKCLCGHAIRYEFWFDQLGPIGSSCIKTMTGLDGKDLQMLIKGSEMARKDAADLQSLKEQFGTLTAQLQNDKLLAEKLDFISREDCVPEDLQKFMENDLPLPQAMRNLVYKIYNEKARNLSVKNVFGPEVYEMTQEAPDIIRLYNAPNRPQFINTIEDINDKILKNRATGKMIEFYKRLMTRARNTRFMMAYDVLQKLQMHDLGEFWNNLVQEYLAKGDQYGLTDGQIALVLDGSASGKPPLVKRFAEKLLAEPQEQPSMEPIKSVPLAGEDPEDILNPPGDEDISGW
jgi:hypothetical protein